jgi:hypothetical protein
MMRNDTATAQVVIASVSSQLSMSCHAGRVNRKKFSGLPKIGSATLPVACGAYQKSASVGHCAIRAKPVTPANTIKMHSEMTRRAGWTDRLIGWPAITIRHPTLYVANRGVTIKLRFDGRAVPT